MQTLWQDLRYGARMLRRQSGFTLIAIMTLALGIGANTAIFSIINGVLLRALPYHAAERLVVLTGRTQGDARDGLSVAEVREFGEQLTTLEDFTAAQSQSVNLTGGERPERVRGAFAMANFFEAFRLRPVLGRTFARGEDQPGAARVVVVSEGFWRRWLNADPQPANRTVMLNGEPYSVIGVVPAAFRHPFDDEVEVWLPAPNFPGNTAQRETRFLLGLGHLKPGVSLEQANAEAAAMAARMAQAYPTENAGRSAQIELMHEALFGRLRPTLALLMAAVGLILLIACANLASLMLARGTSRRREMGVRAALGASRFRLARQLVTETVLLAAAGGGLGLFIATWGLESLLAVNPGALPAGAARLDVRVLLFTLGVALLTGLLCGLVPAIGLTGVELNTALKEGGRPGGEGLNARRARSAFVVVQIALSLVLLIGGALLVKSFARLLRVDPGFRTENLLTLEYRLPRNKYTRDEAMWNFHRQVVERITEVPGVQSAALVRGLPLTGNGATVRFALPDRTAPPKGREPQAMLNTATADYFETIGIPLISGRVFNRQDQPGTPTVYVISQTMAHRFWPGQNPIGRQISIAETGTSGTIIGIVGDAKHYWLSEEMQPQIYDCYAQFPGLFATIVVRTQVEPMSLAPAVREAVWKVDRDQPMWKVRTVESLMQHNVADKRFVMLLMSGFAALALVIAAIGLYGIISFSVSQRTQELGVRLALGARTRDILVLVLRQGLSLVAIGVGIGLVASLALTRLMSGLLYAVSATDPAIYALITILLAGVALAACWIPARRAAKVDPLIALKCE
ncbi:MAG: ABC transporter permease [Blastocatellia bacterium]